MRSLPKILAGVLLVLGTGIALSNLWFMRVVLDRSSAMHARLPANLPVSVMVALGATLCAFGAMVAIRAWMHLRRPDAGTMRDLLSFGIYLTVFYAVSPFLRNHPYLTIATVFGLGILRHYVTRRLTPQLVRVRVSDATGRRPSGPSNS